MMKYTIAIFILSVLCSDSIASEEPPMRYIGKDGSPIPAQHLKSIHEMDCDPNGWKYNVHEWDAIKRGKVLAPKYYKDPVHGSNHGQALA